MWKWFERLAALFAVLGGLYGFFALFIRPRTLKAKLRKLTEMITDWRDEIDCNLEPGLNLAALNNRENKIRDFIERKLKTYWIKPSPLIIQKWNRRMGLEEEDWNSAELFQKYSRVPPEGLPLDMYFQMLVGNFERFHSVYSSRQAECNFAEVEMPVKFLKFYMEALGYGE